jgi:hypothetical protein
MVTIATDKKVVVRHICGHSVTTGLNESVLLEGYLIRESEDPSSDLIGAVTPVGVLSVTKTTYPTHSRYYVGVDLVPHSKEMEQLVEPSTYAKIQSIIPTLKQIPCPVRLGHKVSEYAEQIGLQFEKEEKGE